MARSTGAVSQFTVLLIAFACLAVICADSVAQNRRNSRDDQRRRDAQRNQALNSQRQLVQRSIQAAKAQVAVAKQALAAAQKEIASTQARLQAADGRVQLRLSEVDGAKAHSESTTARLKNIEEQIEITQDDNSELARARRELEEAEKQLNTARERVLGSKQYKQAYERALKLADRSNISKVRSEALAGDDDYQAALLRWEIAKDMHGKIWQGLINDDAQWKAASQQAADARLEQAGFQDQLKGALMTRGAEKVRLTKAIAAANAAQAVIQRGEAVLKSLESKDRQLASSIRNNNRNNNYDSSRRRR